MNSKFQTYGILLATLLIGILLGFLINGQIFRIRMQKAKASFQNTEGRIEQILEKIALTDSQRKEVVPIFEEHFDKMKGIHRRLRLEVRGEMQEFKGSLSEFLSEEQIIQLESEMRFSRRRKTRRDGPGQPPPPMPRPRPEGN